MPGIARGNRLGRGIEAASLPELGPGGSWSTCMLGCNAQPAPRDVAHVQFRARVAFKLVWVPPAFGVFVLVDDDGALLALGAPAGTLPPLRERAMNFRLVQGSKYATAAARVGAEVGSEGHEGVHGPAGAGGDSDSGMKSLLGRVGVRQQHKQQPAVEE